VRSGPLVSVCVLAHHAPTALGACLASLREQSSPPSFEVLVGSATPVLYAEAVREHLSEATVYETGGRNPGAARNLLIERARGDLLLFLDDDVTAPPLLLRRLVTLAELHPQISVFGGPNLTPPGSPRLACVQGAVLASLAGSGPVSRRYGARRAHLADERWFTLCNLAIRRDAMLPFQATLVCAEENELLAELRRAGRTMRYEPGLSVFHARRPDIRSFAAQMFKYGRGRGPVLAGRRGGARVAYLAPPALVLYCTLLPLFLGLEAPNIVLAPAAAYLLLVIVGGGRVGWTMRRAADGWLAGLLIAVVHLGYGIGVLTGLAEGALQQGLRSLGEEDETASIASPPALEMHARGR
jgi:GT2 family glycosyltransferase